MGDPTSITSRIDTELEERVAALEARVDEQVLEWRLAEMEHRLHRIIVSPAPEPDPREPAWWPLPLATAVANADTELEERVTALEARLDEPLLEWRLTELEHRLGRIIVCLDELREWRDELELQATAEPRRAGRFHRTG